MFALWMLVILALLFSIIALISSILIRRDFEDYTEDAMLLSLKKAHEKESG